MAVRTQKGALRYLCDGRPVVVVNRLGDRSVRRFVGTTSGMIHWAEVSWTMAPIELMGKSLFPHGLDWRYELCEY